MSKREELLAWLRRVRTAGKLHGWAALGFLLCDRTIAFLEAHADCPVSQGHEVVFIGVFERNQHPFAGHRGQLPQHYITQRDEHGTLLAYRTVEGETLALLQPKEASDE